MLPAYDTHAGKARGVKTPSLLNTLMTEKEPELLAASIHHLLVHCAAPSPHAHICHTYETSC